MYTVIPKQIKIATCASKKVKKDKGKLLLNGTEVDKAEKKECRKKHIYIYQIKTTNSSKFGTKKISLKRKNSFFSHFKFQNFTQYIG